MYTIVQFPKLTHRQVHGATGPELRLEPLPAHLRPATGQCVYADLSGLEGDDPGRRVEVWSGGTATSAEVLAACPYLRQLRATEIRAEGDRRLTLLATPYQRGERETWNVQMQEALAWTNDPQAATPMLATMAANRGITLAELVAKVLENVHLFRLASGNILGQQQFLLDWVEREQDVATLLAIAWV